MNKSSLLTRLSLVALAVLVFGICGSHSLAQTAPKSAQPAAQKGKALIDLNRATIFDLEQLPGIGGAQADKIIANRPYRAKTDLLSRRILPEATYSQIASLVFAKAQAIKPTVHCDY